MKKMRSFAIALAAATGFAGSAQAMVPVMDQAVISSSNQIAAYTSEQLKRLNDIKSTTDDILKAIGDNGQGEYDLSKNSSWNEFTGGGSLLQALSQYAPNTCAITGCSSGSSASSQKFTDIASARSFIMSNLYASKIVSNDEQHAFAQARRNAEREANVSGYSLALIAREYLANSAARSQKLESIVNGASDLRGDLRANSAVTLVQHYDLTAMLAVLVSSLESGATGFIAEKDHDQVVTGGGTSAPDVYNPQDYLPDGTRIGVDGSSVQGSLNTETSSSNALASAAGDASSLLSAASATGNAGVSSAISSALGTYGSASRASTIFQAGSLAAGSDGYGQAASILSAAASSSSSNLSTTLLQSALSQGAQSSDKSLGWLYQAGQYGVSTGKYEDLVDAGNGTQQPMVNVMLQSAASIASSRGDYEAAGVISQATSALSSGQTDAKSAALLALQVASSATGNTALSAAIRGSELAASGQSSEQVAMSVLSGISSPAGSTLSGVSQVLSSTGW